MAEPLTSALSEDGTEILLLNAEKAEPSEENAWRLSFNRISRFEREERPQQRGLHDCFSVLGPSSGDGVAEYYQQQEEMLEGFTEMDTVAERGYLPGLSKEERDKVAQSETIAIRLSNIANIVLFTAKVYASIKSGSLAIIASTLDSLLDLLSGFILWFTAFKMQSPNPYLYPIGKKRMQPLGILVFASVMATLGLQILLESIRQLIYEEDGLSLDGDKWHWVVGIMVSVTLVKMFLVLYCRSFTNEIVKAYAQDHFFDVITNTIGLIAAILASEFYWWIDPAGAIVVIILAIGARIGVFKPRKESSIRQIIGAHEGLHEPNLEFTILSADEAKLQAKELHGRKLVVFEEAKEYLEPTYLIAQRRQWKTRSPGYPS